MLSDSEEGRVAPATSVGLGEILGIQLRDARRRVCLDQHTVAERMSVARTTISRVENGRKLPSVDFIERFARAVGCPIRLVFGFRDPADRVARRERALRAMIRAYDFTPGSRERFLGRDVEDVLKDESLIPPTANYLRLLRKAAEEGFSRQAPPGFWFKAAVAVASAAFEVIDWPRVREEVRRLGGEPPGRRMRTLHLRVLRRVWDVVTAAEEGRQRQIS